MPVLVVAVGAFILFNVGIALMFIAQHQEQKEHEAEPQPDVLNPKEVEPDKLVFKDDGAHTPRWRVAG